MSDRDTQNATVLRLLREGPISAHDLVYRHGITRVAARVHELKKAGHRIETIPGGKTPDGSREMAHYRLLDGVKPPTFGGPRPVFGVPETGRR